MIKIVMKPHWSLINSPLYRQIAEHPHQPPRPALTHLEIVGKPLDNLCSHRKNHLPHEVHCPVPNDNVAIGVSSCFIYSTARLIVSRLKAMGLGQSPQTERGEREEGEKTKNAHL